MTTVSAIVITKNEARRIAGCLDNLKWADEIVVVDSFSTDQTVEAASQAGATVYQRPFLSFPRQRNASLALATGDWVLFVDADEIVTPALASEVRVATAGATGGVSGYWLPRYNIIWGHQMRGGGWYPDHQLRLLRRGSAIFDEEREVHEVVKLDGDAGCLGTHLIHHNYDGFRQFFAKQSQYAQLEAHSMFRSHFRPRRRAYVAAPLREFYRRFVWLGGYRDGLHGFVLAALLGYYKLVSYFRLRKLSTETFN